MAPRKYEQQLRAESAEQTRRAVLDAAYARLRAAPAEQLSVGAVAEQARVARSTVYLVFGSRAGLFDALARHLRLEAGFDELIREFRRPDALEAMRGSQRAAVRMYAKMPELARAMFTLAAVDPDAVAAIRAIEDGRRPGQADIARRLAAQGYLRDGVDIDEATDILTVITSFQAFDELFSGSGLPADVVADRLVAMTERSICRPDV